MSDPLEPMSPSLKALLREGTDVGPPPGTAARIGSAPMPAARHAGRSGRAASRGRLRRAERRMNERILHPDRRAEE